MSTKFGGFLSSGSSGGSDARSVARGDRQRQVDYAKIARAARTEGRATPGDVKPCFAIALDATGSMDSLIADARSNIGKILDRICAEAKIHVRVRIYAYRDYDVRHAL